jgi:hypothetical protein
MDQHAHLLVRVKAGVRLDPIKHLPDGSYLAKLYRNHHDRCRDRNGIVVRVLRYRLKERAGKKRGCQRERTKSERKNSRCKKSGCKKAAGKEHRLLTTLMDVKLDPARTLIELYHQRWEQELAIDELKTHQSEQGSMTGPMLRSQTPAGVVQELYGLLLDHFVIRKLMFEAARKAEVAPVRISFTGTLKILRCRIGDCPRSQPARLAWYQMLIDEVAEEQLPPRRNRINPRVIKRKMSHWKKKRPEHQNYPQPKQQFCKSIVMLR